MQRMNNVDNCISIQTTSADRHRQTDRQTNW